jgi:hypothetical protein
MMLSVLTGASNTRHEILLSSRFSGEYHFILADKCFKKTGKGTMKNINRVILAVILTSGIVYSQFNNPSIQFGIGISEPFQEMKGTYYMNEPLGSFQALTIDSNFMRNNYGAKTGFYFFGKGKVNFDKYSIVRGTVNLGFNTFNTFEPTKSGSIGVEVININNQKDTILSSVNYNYTLNNFQIGLGLEIAPTSFTNLISPYFGANFSFNTFNGKLTRTENRVDSVTVSFTEFRLGAAFDAGIEAKFSKIFGLSLGIKYDLGNLLLKNTSSGVADRIEWGKTNASMNDEEGTFFSTIYGPVLSATAREVRSKQKNVNWGTIYLAANIYFNTAKKKPPPKK